MTLTWEEREPPLPPAGLVARGSAIERLTQRLARLEPGVAQHLTAVQGEGLLAVLGPREWLPWSDGVLYIAPDPSAPSLFLPTTLRPSVAPQLLLSALTRQFPELALPVACLPTHCFSLALAAALREDLVRESQETP